MPARPVLSVAIAACFLLPAATASGAVDLEAVWSFNGGQVAVRAGSDGSFTGTVIRPTRLASCPHPNGEQM